MTASNPVTVKPSDGRGDPESFPAPLSPDVHIKPTVSCKPATVSLDATGHASISESDVVSAKDDNCGPPNITLSKDSFTCANIGSNTVTVTATDGSGNTETCTATVTVEDHIKPVITCPADKTIQAACGRESI